MEYQLAVANIGAGRVEIFLISAVNTLASFLAKTTLDPVSGESIIWRYMEIYRGECIVVYTTCTIYMINTEPR